MWSMEETLHPSRDKARTCSAKAGVSGGWRAAKIVTSWPPLSTACANVLGTRGVSAPQSTWDGAGEGWEVAAVGLHPVALTQHG